MGWRKYKFKVDPFSAFAAGQPNRCAQNPEDDLDMCSTTTDPGPGNRPDFIQSKSKNGESRTIEFYPSKARWLIIASRDSNISTPTTAEGISLYAFYLQNNPFKPLKSSIIGPRRPTDPLSEVKNPTFTLIWNGAEIYGGGLQRIELACELLFIQSRVRSRATVGLGSYCSA